MDPSSSNATCSQYDQRHRNQPGTSSKKPSLKHHHQYRMKHMRHRQSKEHQEQQEEQSSFQYAAPSTTTPTDPDLSADTHRYFAEARSTPIMYSTCSLHSSTSTSSSSSLEYSNNAGVKNRNNQRYRKADDNRSLCSAHSFTAAQQQQMEYLNNRTGSSITTATHSSTRNQTFYFGTPLPPQKQQPYQYHDSTWYYGDESNTPPWHTPATLSQSQQPSASGSKSSFLARKKDMFLQSNANNRRRLSEGGASIKSAFSTGRQTIKSWRQKRINIMMKQHQLPDFETKVFCEVCEKYIQTRIRYRNGSMVWLMSFILLLCTVILFWVPFYVKYFKDVAHFCPGCGKQLGVSHRL
ncbi:hypothetical protein MBANPS3_007540 [Mucor bainieri]